MCNLHFEHDEGARDSPPFSKSKNNKYKNQSVCSKHCVTAFVMCVVFAVSYELTNMAYNLIMFRHFPDVHSRAEHVAKFGDWCPYSRPMSTRVKNMLLILRTRAPILAPCGAIYLLRSAAQAKVHKIKTVRLWHCGTQVWTEDDLWSWPRPTMHALCAGLLARARSGALATSTATPTLCSAHGQYVWSKTRT